MKLLFSLILWRVFPTLCAVAMVSGCASENHAAQAPAVSTSSLSGHISAAASGVTEAQAALSANDGKATVIRQWLDTH